MVSLLTRLAYSATFWFKAIEAFSSITWARYIDMQQCIVRTCANCIVNFSMVILIKMDSLMGTVFNTRVTTGAIRAFNPGWEVACKIRLPFTEAQPMPKFFMPLQTGHFMPFKMV
jgi:hypothetical protein